MYPLKGVNLNHTIYNNYGLRPSKDFDILIEDKNISEVSDIFCSQNGQSSL